MRATIPFLAVALAVAPATAAEVTLKVRNGSDNEIQFLYRPVQGSFGSPVKVPQGGTVEVTLSAADPFFVQIDAGKGVTITPLDPIPLREWVVAGLAFDVAIAFEARRLPNGTIVPVASGKASAPVKGKSIALASPSLDVQKWTTASGSTQYKAVNGMNVPAEVTLNKSGGTFKTADFEGKLTGVRYSPNKGGVSIQGRWEVGNVKGVFIWNIDKADSGNFQGEWQQDGTNDWLPWTGELKAK
jgi:hypothetical protein